MTASIAGYGTFCYMTASNSFPGGFSITQFSDDADSLDFAVIETAAAGMGLNGDMIAWNKPVPISLTINIIPDSDDDKNLSILFSNNRVGKGKKSVFDIITLVLSYPNGKIITLRNGIITSGMPGFSISSEARFKTKPYEFKFESSISV
jgi:hypothetical protein